MKAPKDTAKKAGKITVDKRLDDVDTSGWFSEKVERAKRTLGLTPDAGQKQTRVPTEAKPA